nr:hypothetical protein [Paraburkholderia tropica]
MPVVPVLLSPLTAAEAEFDTSNVPSTSTVREPAMLPLPASASVAPWAMLVAPV